MTDKENLFPETCIFCQNFPCLDKDQDTSVCCELTGSYPFRLEHPDLKPCQGRDFEPINIGGDNPETEEEEVAVSAPPSPEPKKPETYLKPYIIKAGNPEILQNMLDKIVELPGVISFEIKGFASTYDPEAGTTKLVLILVVEHEKRERKASYSDSKTI